MSPASRRLAGILLVILPTVVFGGVSILTLLINEPEYMQNKLRQDLWRAGHAHAGVLLVLSLIVLRYVDEASLPERLKQIVRTVIPSSAILLPAAFFFSVLRPDATEPKGHTQLDPAITDRLVASVSAASPEPLTPRELEVLTLIGKGSSNNEIAAELNIAPRTTKVHVQNILGKLGATNRTEAVSIAVRRKLISLG
jgi:DNA-binding NarL/FixJ family response regulator